MKTPLFAIATGHTHGRRLACSSRRRTRRSGLGRLLRRRTCRIHVVKCGKFPKTDNRVTIGLDGGAIGVQGGCDATLDAFLAGVYAEYNWFDADETARVNGVDLFEAEINNKWSVGGRFGLLVNPHALAYAKLAYTQGKAGEHDLAGIDIGGGLELLLTSNLALQADYTYTKWNDEKAEDVRFDPSQHVARVGLAYKFGMFKF